MAAATKLSLNERTVFLLDGVGALISVLLTGFLLPQYSQTLGLPTWTLQALAFLPLIYSVFSFSCYRFVKSIRSWMLSAIISANISYCFVSAFIIFKVPEITIWGKLWLSAEIIVVLIVIAIEMKIYRQFFRAAGIGEG